jgi:hypothetical protein
MRFTYQIRAAQQARGALSDAESETSDPSRLSRILAADGVGLWRQDEMGSILRHQLSAPLETDLATADAATVPRMTFGELLHHPHPPVEVLRRVKGFAKACKVVSDGPLPSEVATVLYFATIVVARLRCGQRISELDDEALRIGTEWARAQKWVDEPTRSIFDEAAAKWAAATT